MELSEVRPLQEQSTIKYHAPPVSEGMSRLYERPKRLVFVLVGSVFLAETGVMLLLAYFFNHPLGWESFIDGGCLVVILSPIFYFFYFRPLKHHLTALKTSERQNKFLSRKLISLAEEQQRKLSSDLHDEFGHALTCLVFGIEGLQSSLPQGCSGANQNCDVLIKDLQDLAARVRAFSSDLHLVGLEELGIKDALQDLIRKQQRLHPALMLDFQVFGFNNRPDLAIETVLYRICQEGLNNAIKHSRADKVNIRLTHSHPNLILTLEDNGIGFELQQLESDIDRGCRGIGLLGMRERVAMVGGNFRLVSQVGQGTMIRLELPSTLAEGAAL